MDFILEPGDVMRLTLRTARVEDAALIFHWRNLPEIVALGTTQKTVGWDEHLDWFRATIRSDKRLLLLVYLGGQPIGQVRFDRMSGDRHSTCAVSIYLLPEFTGRGLGVAALQAGCALALPRLAATDVVAFVREENARSLSAFRKAGFVPADETQFVVPAGHRALQLDRNALTTSHRPQEKQPAWAAF